MKKPITVDEFIHENKRCQAERLSKIIPMILRGMGLNDSYRSK